ncbi:MAG: alkyl sulfatase dimerization domain-containing protein [Pseudomonadota bacterium]
MNHLSEITILTLIILTSLIGCGQEPESIANISESSVSDAGNSAPTQHTIEKNKAVLDALPFSDTRDFEEAERGLIAKATNLVVKHKSTGDTLWDIPAYDFIKGEAPDSVNPSLWRQAKLNGTPGLYKVKQGIWQLRNFDLATLSVIEGERGWILVDPSTTIETGAASLAFLKKHLFDDKPVSAILYTHSHADHFGGVRAYVDEGHDEKLQVVAPEGFMEEAASENILLGPAMTRRAGYQYGLALKPGVYGNIDLGLGKSLPFGTTSVIEPNTIIRETGEEHLIDGVRFIFQIASGTEAPSEFTFYLPEHNAFCGAEVISRTMHNIYTLRGAKVRDALLWSKVIDSILQDYGHSDVIFNSHHWPVWGTERITEYLESQRDTYKFIHDQTIHMVLAGMTPKEISHSIKLPENLANKFYSRGYYGTLQHNAKAVYQRYVGWYDGNPANLHPIPPAKSGARYIELMGGIETVIEKAQTYYDNGEYEWVAELLNHAVFSQPDHTAAKELLAKAYDQLGYQAESGPWRSEYLTAAHELRHGITAPPTRTIDALGVISMAPTDTFLETIAVNIDAEKADGKELTLNFVFTDTKERFLITLRNSVMHHYLKPYKQEGNPNNATVTVSLTKEMFLNMIVGAVDMQAILFGDELSIDGSKLDLLSFFASLSQSGNNNFPIVTP